MVHRKYSEKAVLQSIEGSAGLHSLKKIEINGENIETTQF